MSRKILITLCAFVCFFNGTLAQQSRLDFLLDEFENHPEHILVTAHRAAHQKYPENSLAALKEAIRLQVDIVEIDVRKTKDHQLVILHDETIDRVTNGKGELKDLTLKEVKKYNLLFNGKSTDQKILTFDEALDVLKGEVLINIDFKAGKDAISEAYRTIKKKGMEKQALFYVYNHYELLAKLNNLDPNIIVWPRAYSKDDVEKILTYPNIQLIQIDFSFYEDKWTKEVIQKGIRLSGNALGKYDHLEEENGTGFNKITKKHINIIETDFPEELLLYLKKKNLHL